MAQRSSTYDLKLPELKRWRLVIVGLLALSCVATVWSTVLMVRSADLNRRNTASLLPLLERAEEFEREILNARIAFIYYATINKPGSLEQGWARYHQAQDALADLHTLSRANQRRGMLEPRLEALDTAWETYAVRLQSVLTLVQNGTRSGANYNQTIGEWAADGSTLVNDARDLVKTTAAVSRAQSGQTGDMLSISTGIIAANGAFSLLLSFALVFSLGKRSQAKRLASADFRAGELPAEEDVSLLAYALDLAHAMRRSGRILLGLGGMLLLILIVLGTGFAALRGTTRLSNAQAANRRSQQILLDAESLRALSFAAESDTRGFAFSGREALLVSQQMDIRNAWKEADKLSREADPDPQQRAYLQEIRIALGKRFETLQQVTDVRRQSGPEAVSMLIANGHNLAMKHELQAKIDQFESAQNQRIVTGTLRAERAAAVSKTLILFAALPAALTLTLLSVIMAHLLSRSRRLQEQLTHQAQHDVLTGLPNRSSLEERLERMIEQARSAGMHCGVFGIDLDRFKEVNDRFGHHNGDKFLCEVARRLSSVVRQTDTLIRVGGDEFLCLAERIGTPADAELIADKLLGSLRDPIKLHGGWVRATASIGFAVYPGHGDSAEALTRHADDALYRAKEAGRNQAQVFKEDVSKAREQLILECLATALEQERFHLVYQPQYTAQGALRGFEALLRLTHPSLGPVSPAEFIPLAERSGLIVPIGTWVLEQACGAFATWVDTGLDPGLLSINVSAAQFSSGNFAHTVAATLRAAGLSPERLELELTESMMMVDPEESALQMRVLALTGVRLAIDDFGTGYSSLGHLNRLPISTLKIDRTFIRQLGEGHSSRPIVEAVVALGKALGITIVAEGVETDAQRTTLCAMGCEHFQGFLFARPLYAEAVEDLLQSVGIEEAAILGAEPVEAPSLLM